MPIIINEITAETSDNAAHPAQTESSALQVPLSLAEAEIMQTLAISQQRIDRLKID